MLLSYTGNGTYCYANSLHMSLLGAGANPQELASPGFLECLTGGPFGKLYLRLEDGPVVFFSPPISDPDQGLTRAIDLLGWQCEEWYGDDGQEALARLREVVQSAPVLLGPLDMGYLSYHPNAEVLKGADHFVVALAIESDQVLVHDPGGYPCAVLPITHLLQAWQAEKIPYGRGPHTMRSHFRQVYHPSRQETIQRALPALREYVQANPGGPVVYGGAAALNLLANDLRGAVPPSISNSLIWFVLPLAARRSLDAATFLREAGRSEAAALMERQARLVGQAQSMATAQQWSAVAGVIDQLALLEQQLANCL